MKLFLLISIVVLSSCRDDKPPVIEVCTLNGTGLGLCKLADGTEKRRPPSEMKRYWATNQEDMKKFVKWCYEIPNDEEMNRDEMSSSPIPEEKNN